LFESRKDLYVLSNEMVTLSVQFDKNNNQNSTFFVFSLFLSNQHWTCQFLGCKDKKNCKLLLSKNITNHQQLKNLLVQYPENMKLYLCILSTTDSRIYNHKMAIWPCERWKVKGEQCQVSDNDQKSEENHI
jgi:hypothetical protein